VAVKIRLKRFGKMRAPYYRIVVVDSRAKRDGRVIEEIGKYHPTEDPSVIEVDSERVQYWLSVGAQPSDPVLKQLKILGEWQKFKGLPGQEGTLRLPKRQAEAAAAIAAAEEAAIKATAAATAAAEKTKKAEEAAAKAAAEAAAAAQAEQSAAEAAAAEVEAVEPPAEAKADEPTAAVDATAPAEDGAEA
jgi:small subunit ribosomal protein S16